MNVSSMEKYALENNIPIMEKEGIEYLIQYIKEHNIKNILEIGSAIGYSAIRMALISKDIKIITIERDKARYDEAVKNIKFNKLEKQINIILGDALEENIEGNFDLIFIDAAKAQSINFFEKYEPYLDSNGTIITDNINFHGLTFSNDLAPTRNLRQLVRKIKNYLTFLEKNNNYNSTYVNIGDGLMISVKK